MRGLTQIGAVGFKSIKGVQELHPSALNVLIGANGAGKSNLISILQMLGAIAESRLQIFVAKNGYANRLLHYGAKQTPNMSCWIEFPTKTGDDLYYFQLSAAADDTLVFALEDVGTRMVADGNRRRHNLGGGQRESRLLEGEGQFVHIRDMLGSIRVFHFEDTSPNAPIRKACRFDDDQSLHDDGSNLAAVLYRLKKSQRDVYKRIVSTIRQMAPFFDDFRLEVHESMMVLLRWTDRDSTYVFSADQLSDGTLRAITMITLLLQPEDELPRVIVLDEPELGLHPYALEVLASLLRRASASCQIIVATQSISLVNQFKPEDIIVATREGSGTDFKRLRSEDLEKWLDEYAVGDLWRKNLIGGTPYR
jgi:predicted ATPase